MTIQTFMGEDGKFVVAYDAVVGHAGEHHNNLEYYCADHDIRSVRLIVKKRAKRFWTSDRKFCWDVHAWLELR